jgi:hypothetical protein
MFVHPASSSSPGKDVVVVHIRDTILFLSACFETYIVAGRF